MKQILYVFVLIASSVFSFQSAAQCDFSLSADMQSRYVWRGQPLGGEGPSLQPAASVSWNGLSFGLWGAYNVGVSEYQELDFSLSYTFLDEMLTLLVTDYSFPVLMGGYRYFDYEASHVLEAGVLFAVPKTNLSLGLYTNVYGADAVLRSGAKAYSTYAELSYALPWESKHVEFDFAVGAALNGDAGLSFYGNDGFGVVNVSAGATKVLELTPSFSLPVYVRLIANPVADKMFLVCGTTIGL